MPKQNIIIQWKKQKKKKNRSYAVLVNRQYFWVIKLKKKNVWHWVYVIIVTPQLIFLFLFPVVVYFGRSFFFGFGLIAAHHTHSLSLPIVRFLFCNDEHSFTNKIKERKRKEIIELQIRELYFLIPFSFHPALSPFLSFEKSWIVVVNTNV